MEREWEKRESKTKEPKKRKRGRAGRVLARTFQALLIILLSALVVVAIWFYVRYGKQILSYQSKAKKMVGNSSAETFRADQTSLVYTDSGELIAKLSGVKDVYYLEYDNIPQYAVQAMICTEDHDFFTHDGIDFGANVRAAIALMRNKGEIHQGASTITQQVARNIFLTNEVTWERKITEIFVAMELEKKYSKHQIFEFYLNNIYFANGYYGLQSASVGYFDQSVSELSLSQIAFLCAIPNNPTDYNPLTNYHYTMERRDKVLVQMRDQGVITESQYQEAIKESIVLQQSDLAKKNYIESYTYHCAVRALMERKGFVFRYQFVDEKDKATYDELYYDVYYATQKSLYTGGYRIYTSINLATQDMLQSAIDEELAEFTETNEEGTYKLQASGVCIDNETGRVIAVVGGRSQEAEGYTLNRAFQSFRQPGSSIKPLIVYTPSFEKGLYPTDLVLDEKFEGGPRNSGGVYSGEITVERAVTVSKNTIAWKLFQELTPRVGLSYLLNMGFRRIVPQDYVPAAALGGLTYGVSAVELASGYCALENDGMFRQPTCIVRITDPEGNELVGETITPQRIYELNASRMMVHCMQNVMKEGTGLKLALNGQISAGKTGTTNDQKDGWFAGFTKHYTTAIWVGCDYPKAMEELRGNTYPGYIWKHFMDELHVGLPKEEFAEYADNRPQGSGSLEENANGEDGEENSEEDLNGADPGDLEGGDWYDVPEDTDSGNSVSNDSGETVIRGSGPAGNGDLNGDGRAQDRRENDWSKELSIAAQVIWNNVGNTGENVTELQLSNRYPVYDSFYGDGIDHSRGMYYGILNGKVIARVIVSRDGEWYSGSYESAASYENNMFRDNVPMAYVIKNGTGQAMKAEDLGSLAEKYSLVPITPDMRRTVLEYITMGAE